MVDKGEFFFRPKQCLFRDCKTCLYTKICDAQIELFNFLWNFGYFLRLGKKQRC